MENNDRGTMEDNEKAITTDETKINYRGWKSMPFIIGEWEGELVFSFMPFSSLFLLLLFLFSFSFSHLGFVILASEWPICMAFQVMKLLRNWEPLEPWPTSWSILLVSSTWRVLQLQLSSPSSMVPPTFPPCLELSFVTLTLVAIRLWDLQQSPPLWY